MELYGNMDLSPSSPFWCSPIRIMGGLAGGHVVSGLKTCLAVDVFLTSFVFIGGGESSELDGVKGGLSARGNSTSNIYDST